LQLVPITPFLTDIRSIRKDTGDFSLKTRFALELSKLPQGLGWFFVWVYVDGEPAARTAFMLQWL
jgi:hypothetical protein